MTVAAPRIKSMSARKSKVTKSVQSHKYASKFVEQALDKLIATRLQTCRYPKATDKWMRKLRSSILKKVSENSVLAFQTEELNPEHLRGQVADLMEKIQSQRERIGVLLEEEGKSTTAALAQRPASKQAPYESGQFEGASGRIKKQFEEVARLLEDVTTEIEPRRITMEDMLNSVRKQVQPLLTDLQNRRQKQPQSGAAGSGRGSAKKAAASGSNSGTGSKGTQHLHQVQRMLNKK